MDYKFQSTFPRGERHYHGLYVLSLAPVFQSTFPRGERHIQGAGTPEYINFNPRSRVGNDELSIVNRPYYLHFNPRSRVGNDMVPAGL